MKIKKVEIDSFRLFDDEKILFVNPHHQEGCANLVAIHAPNGFGKTSLFDAIEFCMTKNIKRLKDTVVFSDDVRSDKEQNAFSSFIHNKDYPTKEIGIRIEFEDGTPKGTKVAPADELKMLKGKPENEYFSDVMLSQDWFSRFLSATDATQRFEIFTRNFKDTEGLLDYYEQLKTAHNIIKKRISDSKTSLSQERKKLNENVDALIVEHLDEAVRKLSELGVVIDWNRTINDKQLEHLSLQGDQKKFENEEERRFALSVVGDIEKVKNGQEGLIAISELSVTLTKLEALAQSIKGVQTQLQKIQTLKAIIAVIEKLNIEIAKYEAANKDLDYLIQKYAAYKDIADKICEITKQRVTKIKERELLSETISLKSKEFPVLQDQYDKLTKERDGWKNKKDCLKEEYAKYFGLLSQIKHANEEELKENQKLSQLYPKIENQEKEQQRLTQIVVTLQQGLLSVPIDDYKEESQKILLLEKNIKEKETLVDNLERSIQEQQNYMGQVEALVVSAREMSVTLKSGVCPLCGQNYGRIEDLLTAIEGNKSISKSIEDTLKLKAATKLEILNLKNESIGLYQLLEEKTMERINASKVIIENLLVERGEIEKAIAEIRQKRQTAQEKIKTDYAEFENQTEEQIRVSYEERLQQAEKQLAEATKLKEALAEDLVKMQAMLNDLTRIIDGLSNELMEKQTQPDYVEYQRKLDERGQENPSIEEWKKKLDENNKTISEFKGKIASAINEKTTLEGEGISLAEEIHLTEYMDSLIDDKKALDACYLRTVQFVRDDCKAKSVDSTTTPEVIGLEIEKSKKLYAERAEVCENIEKSLIAYLNLLNKAEQYNSQQIIKKNIDDIKKQKEEYEQQLDSIDVETENLKKYLEEFVQSYFQLDLINRLYNTIDPHPRYKKVEFKCDFNQKKPRLLVIMGHQKDDGDKIVPNLYLSTAQINILSFCIFMAKALFAKTDKGKEINCIFVDDPIQALDDINVLSMIDLLRNVAFTLNKQIVITTHDLNFFNLLQKKMPQDKFNSCYLQLKERGKFSVVEN